MEISDDRSSGKSSTASFTVASDRLSFRGVPSKQFDTGSKHLHRLQQGLLVLHYP
jgi:hypothetical protein